LGLPYSTTHHLFKHAKGVKLRLNNVEEALSWSTVQKKKNSRSEVTEEMWAELHTWILNHLHVVDSLIARDMLS
jgi:hemerythrin